MEVVVHRTPVDDRHSIGVLQVVENGEVLFECKTVERGWLNNKPNVSCVRPGVYDLVLEYSDAFQMVLWELKNVEGRSECKIHVANHWHQLRGCIAVGEKFLDFDKDGALDITNSTETLMALHQVLRGITRTKITIKQA